MKIYQYKLLSELNDGMPILRFCFKADKKIPSKNATFSGTIDSVEKTRFNIDYFDNGKIMSYSKRYDNYELMIRQQTNSSKFIMYSKHITKNDRIEGIIIRKEQYIVT